MSIEQKVTIEQKVIEQGIHPDLNEKLNEVAPLLKQILAGSQGRNVVFGPKYTGTTSHGEGVSIITICQNSTSPDFLSLGNKPVFPHKRVLMLARSSEGFPIGFQELNISFPHVGRTGAIRAQDMIITGVRDMGVSRVLEKAAQDWYQREATEGSDVFRKIKYTNTGFVHERNSAAKREIEKRESNPEYNPNDEYYYAAPDVAEAWFTNTKSSRRNTGRIAPYPDITILEEDPNECRRYMSIFGERGLIGQDERYVNLSTTAPEASLHAYMTFSDDKNSRPLYPAAISLDENITIPLPPEFYQSDMRKQLLDFCMNWANVGGILKTS